MRADGISQVGEGVSKSPRWRRDRASAGRSYRIKDHATVNERRIELGLSHRDLARRASCSKAMVGFVCTGERDRITEQLAVDLARALEWDPGDLVIGWPSCVG